MEKNKAGNAIYKTNHMQSLKRTIESIHEKGLIFLLKKRLSKLSGGKISHFSLLKELLENKNGLEIGGPSSIFQDKGVIPIYNFIKTLDGCNFSTQTIWEGNIENGNPYFYYPDKSGIQYISEAADLSVIKDASYDFVISSNCLEHVANPLRAVKEWIRVIKPNGIILLALPNKAYCFDHYRPITSFDHLIKDFQNNIQEDDLTHLNEILQLHDLTMDLPAGDKEQFKSRSLKNLQNRTLHHHVFDVDLLKSIFHYFKLEIILTHKGRDYVIVGKKI